MLNEIKEFFIFIHKGGLALKILFLLIVFMIIVVSIAFISGEFAI